MVGFRQPLEPLHQLRQISGVLGLNSQTHHRGDTELHNHVVGHLEGGDGSSLTQELVNSNETTDDSSWDILNSLNTS